jgi:Helix-turn-helix domain
MVESQGALDELISLAEAAKRYGLSANYLRDIATSGRLKARKIGNSWVATPAAVEDYIASREKKGCYREDLKT